jgi:recombinational DNA repair protein RecT
MAAMAARTVLKRIMTSRLVDILIQVPTRVQEDDQSSSIQLREIRQVKLSKQKRSYGGGI